MHRIPRRLIRAQSSHQENDLTYTSAAIVSFLAVSLERSHDIALWGASVECTLRNLSIHMSLITVLLQLLELTTRVVLRLGHGSFQKLLVSSVCG